MHSKLYNLLSEFFVCMILPEPVVLDSRNVAQAWPAGST